MAETHEATVFLSAEEPTSGSANQLQSPEDRQYPAPESRRLLFSFCALHFPGDNRVPLSERDRRRAVIWLRNVELCG